ncbi:type VI secretion system tube protein Hcp, partial [Klebsiella pneumoniae]|uniref:Hcp family type VI secretion system effector n=1 Tax=Klebsiella pneumoniae TaxID=573 RepID=UPI00148FB10E
DTNGSPITGSSLVTGRICAIELKAVTHHLSIPVDGNTGRLTGTRVHTPITVQKDFDKTTPLLYKELSENQTLKSATIKMYQIIDAGVESEYFNI